MTGESKLEDRRMQREQGDVNTTPNRRKYWERNLSREARRWFEEDARYFLHQSLSTPVLNVIAGAEGIYIDDLDGKRFIDMHGNGVHNAGFNHPEVMAAVRRQLDEGLTFCPRRYTNIPAIQLAKKLAEITPAGLCRSLFCPGGSEAIEMALKLARQVTGRFKTISFWDSFHGAGFGAAGIGGEEHFHGGLGPMMPGTFHVEFPNYYRNPWGFTREEDVDAECLRQIELVLRREPEMSAIIGEPISANPVDSRPGATGRACRDLCRRYGVLLIFDEIIEGFGRTGKMFASEHFVTPGHPGARQVARRRDLALGRDRDPRAVQHAASTAPSATTPTRRTRCARRPPWRKSNTSKATGWPIMAPRLAPTPCSASRK